MIGRGTRLCLNLLGEGKDKESFSIFDFCGNFTYFEMKAEGEPATPSKSLKERLFLKRVALLESMAEGTVKEKIRAIVRSQIDALDVSQYHLKKVRHTVEALHKADLAYITEETKAQLKEVAEYIEDATDVEVQRYEMLTLNAQEAEVKGKESKAYVEQIKERCFILKSKAGNISAIQKEEKLIDAVLDGTFELDDVEKLETLKEGISHLANLSLGKRVTPVETKFRDEIEAVRSLKSEQFIDKATVQTEVQKVLSAYLEKLSHIKLIEESNLITDRDINDLKHQVFDYEKMVQDRLENKDAFAALMQEILNSSKKEIANRIFDNYIEVGNYTQKQIEVTNRIKNILFGKQYATLEDSLQEVKEDLTSEIHPLATVFERLSEMEQEMIVELIGLLGSVESAMHIEKKNASMSVVNSEYDDLGMVAEPEVGYGGTAGSADK